MLLVVSALVILGAGYAIVTRGDSSPSPEALAEGPSTDATAEGHSTEVPTETTQLGVDELPSGALCVLKFSPETLRTRAFAFDGTVVSTMEGPTRSPDAGGGTAGFLAVFEIHHWFKGGNDNTVEVLMQRDVLPGERFLVSGQPLWGGEPLDDPIAWECGGFTSLYSAPTAEMWAAAWSDP